MTDTPSLADLLDSWVLQLTTARKSPHTIASYRDGVIAFLRWCEETQTRASLTSLTKPTLQAFTTHLLQSGRSAATAYSRHVSMQRFSAFLLEDGELATDELRNVTPPKLDEQVIDPLSDDEIKALLKACAGAEFTDRRDEAILRFMVETAARAREVVGMRLSTTNILEGTTVLHGKGGKERLVPYGPFTARALDRYKRARRTHKLAATDTLWLGHAGRTLGYHGLYYTLGQRAEAAGIVGFHPHRLRHTGADRWLAAGGTEGGLMTVAGWDSQAMLRRYTKRRSAIRALEESRRLNLGEF